MEENVNYNRCPLRKKKEASIKERTKPRIRQ